MPTSDPIAGLRTWLDEARQAGEPTPGAMALATATADGGPSLRTVTLKRLEDDALVFTTALWTRKADEIGANPRVALLFHWPALGRQVHVTGAATLAERALAEELYAQRDPAHQLQTVVSRQGEPIETLDAIRDRLAHLAGVQETVPACPEDWGALRIRPQAIEFWSEAPDRLHDRRLFERDGAGWKLTLLAP